ncbi:replication/maintenance protein RepL [Staphylococcus agnetis]|uniref:replication/maintenance protein RepL n=1 Tax=Staphylococcus agnetis TaxID=985762 RepID=UPI00208FBD9A|nr:replication/maintenance protein RepL [Staphylococcus agnetis]MCO4356034.1 replication/maintenance protein RepL [Staphylococcus agnetis]MCO4365811.1 replication/maintenance protein RepL [Staphylococcus agnetis]
MSYQCINLEHYQNFDSVSEMDNTVKQFNSLLNKTHYETLNLLKQYSCKVIGVSHIKVQTIAKQLGKSVATIKRHLKYLKENGFISIINTFRRKMGGKGANAYVINSVEYRDNFLQKIKNEPSQMSYRESTENTNENVQPQALKNVDVQKETINSLKLLKSFISTAKRKSKQYLERIEAIKNHRSCPKQVPHDLYMLNKAYFSDKQIAIIYKTIHKNITKREKLLTDDQITNIYYDTFKSIVSALRKYHKGDGKEIKNMFAYANTASQRQTLKYSCENAWYHGFN